MHIRNNIQKFNFNSNHSQFDKVFASERICFMHFAARIPGDAINLFFNALANIGGGKVNYVKVGNHGRRYTIWSTCCPLFAGNFVTLLGS